MTRRFLVIDLDGTLVDRDAVIEAWATSTAAHYPMDRGLRDWLIRFDKLHDGGIRDRTEFLTGVRTRLSLSTSINELLAAWPEEFGGRYVLDARTHQALLAAREAGHRIAVVTNGATDRQGAKIAAMCLESLVDVCLISESVSLRKPDPAIFKLAADQADATLDDAWVIGDDPDADIAGGHRIGARTVWINRTGRAWPPGFTAPTMTSVHVADAIHAATTER